MHTPIARRARAARSNLFYPRIFLFFLRGICASNVKELRRIERTIQQLAKGYYELHAAQAHSETLMEAKKEEFFGLRDFYR